MTAAQDAALDSAFALLSEHFGGVVLIAQPRPDRTALEIRHTGNAIALQSMTAAAHGWLQEQAHGEGSEEESEEA